MEDAIDAYLEREVLLGRIGPPQDIDSQNHCLAQQTTNCVGPRLFNYDILAVALSRALFSLLRLLRRAKTAKIPSSLHAKAWHVITQHIWRDLGNAKR